MATSQDDSAARGMDAARKRVLVIDLQDKGTARFDEGKMRIPDDRIIAKQNAAKTIDTASVIEGGKHPCLNRRS